MLCLPTRGWQLKVYLACIEVQFVATPSGTCAEVAAMDLLAQLCGSCTSAFLQIGAKRAMQWTPGERALLVLLFDVTIVAPYPARAASCK